MGLLERFWTSRRYADCHSLLTARMVTAPPQGMVLEFGVWSGRTIRHIAEETGRTVYGFDSFRGLPEDWDENNPAGHFGTDGLPPEGLPANVELVVGMFGETLPGFLAAHAGPVALVHVDCDLYSSTKTVLDALEERFVDGTVVNFNEFWGYVGADEHEFLAFSEFLARGWEAQALGRAGDCYCQAAFVLRRRG